MEYRYLNFDALDAIDAKAYREHKPYPYSNFPHALTDAGYASLVASAPSDLSLFEKQFGIERRWGQGYHDKYYLEYGPTLPLSDAWKGFVAELYSPRYRRFLEALFGMRRGSYDLVLSWHFMPRGTSITPHCDTEKKIGSQLFYLNTSRDWDEAWGGQTLAMDDEGKLDPRSGPKLSEFKKIFTSKAIDTYSFIFTRTPHSWHAVDTIDCPENVLRKMFSVVVNRRASLYARARAKLRSYLR